MRGMDVSAAIEKLPRTIIGTSTVVGFRRAVPVRGVFMSSARDMVTNNRSFTDVYIALEERGKLARHNHDLPLSSHDF